MNATHSSNAPSSPAPLQSPVSAALRRAFVTGGVVFAASLISIAGLFLVHRLIESSAVMDWKLLFELALGFSVFWFLVSFASTWTDLKAAIVRGHALDPSFSGAAFYRAVWWVCAIFGVVMMVGSYRQGEVLTGRLVPLGLFVLAWFGWPRRIYFYSDALGQKTYFGKMRRIPYHVVEDVSYDQRRGYTIVAGEGNRIIHTPLHAGRGHFHDLIQKRTGKQIRGT